MELTKVVLPLDGGVRLYVAVAVDGNGAIYATEQAWGARTVHAFLWELGRWT